MTAASAVSSELASGNWTRGLPTSGPAEMPALRFQESWASSSSTCNLCANGSTSWWGTPLRRLL